MKQGILDCWRLLYQMDRKLSATQTPQGYQSDFDDARWGRTMLDQLAEIGIHGRLEDLERINPGYMAEVRGTDLAPVTQARRAERSK